MSVDIVTGAVLLPAPDATDLLSVDDAKAHCRIDFDDDDVLVGAYIAAAVAIVETEVQRALLPRTYAWTCERLHGDMRLPLAPVKQVRSIAYLPFPSGAGGALPLDPSLYYLARRGAGTLIRRPWGAVWPFVGEGPAPVVVTFDAGDLALVSTNVLHALKMIVADLYDNRSPSVLFSGQYQMNKLGIGVQTTVQALLAPERW